MKNEPMYEDDARLEAGALNGESEASTQEAGRAPENAPVDADEDHTRRDDLTVAPEDLAARFLSEATQADPSSHERDAIDTEGQLPLASEGR